MKTQITTYLLTTLCLVLFTGCPNTYDRKVHQTIDATQTLVEVALATFKELNINSKITAKEYDQVQAYYQDYQAAMNVAIDAAQGDTSQFTPETALRLSTQVISLIERFQNR